LDAPPDWIAGVESVVGKLLSLFVANEPNLANRAEYSRLDLEAATASS
jgi:hypothetical protein